MAKPLARVLSRTQRDRGANASAQQIGLAATTPWRGITILSGGEALGESV